MVRYVPAGHGEGGLFWLRARLPRWIEERCFRSSLVAALLPGGKERIDELSRVHQNPLYRPSKVIHRLFRCECQRWLSRSVDCRFLEFISVLSWIQNIFDILLISIEERLLILKDTSCLFSFLIIHFTNLVWVLHRISFLKITGAFWVLIYCSDFFFTEILRILNFIFFKIITIKV